MKKEILQELREEKQKNINNISIDFINNYSLEYSDYICDAIMNFSDSQIDIYYYNLNEWLKEEDEAIEYFEEVINEGLIDTKNFDFHKCIQAAQFELYSRRLYEDIEEIINILVIDYLLENEELLENIEDIEELLENIDKDHNNRLEDIKYYILEELKAIEE